MNFGEFLKTSISIENLWWLLPMVVGARQSFQFFKQITWFLGNIRALPKFEHWILHYLICIIKLKSN